MKTLFLTSSLNLYFNKGNHNRLLTNLKKYIKKYDNFVFVGNGCDDDNLEDYFYDKVQAFELTLPFKHYTLIKNADDENAKELIENADFIFVSGGHVPTQNRFLKDLKLKELLKSTDAVICGESAGSINCAKSVYCPPELQGESVDINFNRHLKGLGLTNIAIMPHFNMFENATLDNQRYVDDILLPDSYDTDIFALVDGSYILQTDNETAIYGEAKVLRNGRIKKVCENNNKRVISNYQSQLWA